MKSIPSKFFVTHGSATSRVSSLNAFDKALISAGIGEQNLVYVSSVIPMGAERVNIHKVPMGSITHCVLAQMMGYDGEIISSGIAYAYRKDGNGGYVVEGHIYGSTKSLKENLICKMDEMSKVRGIELGDLTFILEELSIPIGHYGCCIASLVFTDYR